MAFAAARSDSMAEINITPLVDVMLVLLVIFMVTAPLLEHRIGLTLPQAVPPTPRTEPAVLELRVQPGDLFALDGQDLPASALQARLAEWRSREPGGVLKVRISPEADYQSAATALAAADRAGIEAIGLE